MFQTGKDFMIRAQCIIFTFTTQLDGVRQNAGRVRWTWSAASPSSFLKEQAGDDTSCFREIRVGFALRIR